MFETTSEATNSVADTNATNRLEVVGVSKTYGVTRAVRTVGVSFESTQITAVVGGNGAGKSTLMKMIAGEASSDSGELRLNGESIDSAGYGPAKAHAAGIRIVHQELSLFGSLSVAENFYVEQGGSRSAGLAWRAQAKETADRALTEAFGPGHNIAPGTKVDQLNPGQQQMVEIARAASAEGLRVLILDEPTSALGLEYVDSLASFVRRLQSKGIVVLFITHKMSELPKLTDRIVVMREGQLVADMPTSASTTEGLLTVMLGGEQSDLMAGVASDAREPVGASAKKLVTIDTQSVSTPNGIFVRAGEVVGIVGLQDSGQEELLRSIQTGSDKNVKRASRSAYVTGDRKNEGIFPLWDSVKNLSVSALVDRGSWTPFRRSRIQEIAAPWFKKLSLAPDAANKNIAELSGGMQQKVLFARGLATDAQLLLLNDPTRGVDLATKRDMYQLVRDAASSGKGVLWYSSEDAEVELFDRVYVMHEGRVVAEFAGEAVSSEAIMKAAFASQDESRAQRIAPTRRDRGVRLLRSVVSQPWIFAFVGLAITLGIIDSKQNVLTYSFGLGLILTLAPVLAIAAISQMFIVSVGDIDLGIGAFMGLIGVIAATSLGTEPLLGLALIIGVTALYPLLAWFLRVRQFPALVATLAMSFVYTGLALTILPNVGGQVPDWLTAFSRISIPIVPLPIVLLLVIGVAGWFIVERTRLGTRIRALGSNPAALSTSGWNVTLVKVSAYALAGISATIAGLLFAGIATAGDASAADGYTLMSIAAVVVGGCEFLGGKVSPVGVVLAATLLALLGVLLGVLAVPPLFTAASTGGLLLLVMGLRRLIRPIGRA